MLIYSPLSAKIQKNPAQIAQYLIDSTIFLSGRAQTGHSTEQYGHRYKDGLRQNFARKKGLTTAGRGAIIVNVQGQLAQVARARR